MSSFLKTSRRLTRKIEATVKKEEEKESRGGPGEPVLRLLLLLPSWSSSAIIFPFFFSLFLYLALFRPTFSTGNQARIRYRRISPINLLLFSSLLFLCFFYSLSRIRSDSSRYPRCLISPCLRFFPFFLDNDGHKDDANIRSNRISSLQSSVVRCNVTQYERIRNEEYRGKRIIEKEI